MIDFKGSWDDDLPLIEYAYNIGTIPTFRWPFMRHYMGVDVDLLSVVLN